MLHRERNHFEVCQDGILDDSMRIRRCELRLKWQGGEGREEFGETVRGDQPCQRLLLDREQSRKGDPVLRMLLHQRRDEDGRIEASFHWSNATDLPNPSFTLFFDKGTGVPR
jgi:hypothetical protein